MKKIIYQQETGLAVITPSGSLTVEETALKDVPRGVKFKIIDVSDLVKRFSGGGHPHAAGAEISIEEFLLLNKYE